MQTSPTTALAATETGRCFDRHQAFCLSCEPFMARRSDRVVVHLQPSLHSTHMARPSTSKHSGATQPAPTPWHSHAPEHVLDALDASSKGLSAQEAAKRLQRHGPNRLEMTEG